MNLPRSRRWVWGGALFAVAILCGTGVVYWETQGDRSGQATPPSPLPPTSYTTVDYASSVDQFSLSYDEWLPTTFDPATSYPLVVYLHGQQDTSGRWFSGGLTNDLTQSLTGSVYGDRVTADTLINATRAQGAILIALNTRSGSGWYIDSPCGGPQEQDVLDGIHFEESLRHVSKVFLMGESMGTAGTLFVASQNPGLFAGIAVVAPVTDLFEDVAYRMTLLSNPNDPWANISIQAKAHLFCGVLPGTGNASQLAVARMFQNMSPLRFDPSAFRDVPVYLTAGALDDRAPNNVTIWAAWMNANNTFVNATCNHASALGEPAPPSCATQTLDSLHRQDPAGYTFRYVFEANATHSISQLNPGDLLDFWLGGAPGGYYIGAPLSGPVTLAPNLVY